MSAEGYTGPNSFAFFIKETGQGKGSTGGTVAVPVAPVAGDTHIPFNPMKSVPFTLPLFKQVSEILAGDIQASTFTTGGKELGKVPIKDAYYHAPFLLAKIFPKKEVGVWAADLTATLAFSAALADFIATPESMAIHIHLDDKDADTPADIDVNLYGGVVEEYAWKFKVDDDLREDAEIVVTNLSTSAIAYNSASTFQNGRYAMWNDVWIADGKVRAIPFSALIISTYAALDAAIKVKGGEFRIKMPRNKQAYIKSDASTGLVETANRSTLEVTVTLDVEIVDDEVYSQEIVAFASRTDATPKIAWSSGAFGEYLQCTKMKLDPDGEYEIPENKPDSPRMSKTLKFIASSDSVLTFAGTYDQSETPVPTNYV
jgi:hypothetical protein